MTSVGQSCYAKAADMHRAFTSSRSIALPLRRRACLNVHARQVNPPPRRPQQPSPGDRRGLQPSFGGQRGSDSRLTLPAAVQLLNQIWQGIQPRRDPKAGIPPGRLGKKVQLLTNHFPVQLTQVFASAPRYTISMTVSSSTQQTPSSPTKQKKQPSGSPAIPLDVRQQVLSALAQQLQWPSDAWVYDRSANLLVSLNQLEPKTYDVKLPRGQATGNTYKVTITPTTGPADQTETLQQLGLVLKASLIAALPNNTVETPGSYLLPKGPTTAAAPPGAGRGSGVRGRGGGGGGRGGGGRGGGGYPSSMGPLQLWDGLRSAIKPGQQAPSVAVQVDSTTAAVLPAGRLSELVVWPGGATTPAELCKNKALLAAAEEAVMGAKVRVDHLPSQARNVWGLDQRTPQQYNFTDKTTGKQTTVADYFRSQYPQLQLWHLHDWPCVVTNKGKTAAIPLELCSIDKPQARRSLTARQTADLIKQAALPPQQRLKTIQSLARQLLTGAKASLLQTWGISVSQQLLKVDGRILPDAKLQYGRNSCTDAANRGQWRAPPGATLLQPPQLSHWAVLNLANSAHGDVEKFVNAVVQQAMQQGGSASPPAIVDGSRYATLQAAVTAAAERAGAGTASSAQLLLIILKTENTKQYNEVKAAAGGLAIPSQCLVASKAGIGSGPVKTPYVANLFLKITAKTDGVGWQLAQGPEVWAPPLAAAPGGLMLLGIDVGHGIAGGSGNKPSIAAVVGSVNAKCSRYSAAMLEQTAGHEIVLGLRDAAVHLLQQRQDFSNGKLPGALLVYRDGVSDSQYLEVLLQEVPALQHACMDVGGENYKPKITYVIVSKSHGTRLFPSPDDPSSSDESVGLRSGNVVPGTVVDTVITAPSQALKYEFFLNSHAGIQGTNKPGRYNVLVDDSNLSPDALQLITQHLASTYCACSRTISCPAVVRYADKAAGASWAASISDAGTWVTVQPGSPGVKALEYKMMQISQAMAGKMWFV